ncbi:MAG TPA: UPF0175 family protein [Verrucomicrobiae bacterium]
MPDEIAHALGDNEQAVARRILENAAIESYRDGRLTQRQVGEMLGFDYWQTEQFLADHQVTLNYRESDLEADIAALPRIIGG